MHTGTSTICFVWQVSYGRGGVFEGQLQYSNSNFGVSSNIQSNKQHMNFIGIFSFAQTIGKNLHANVSVFNPWETYTTQTIEENSADFL